MSNRESSAITLIEIPASQLKIDIQPLENRNKGTQTAISNAWRRAGIDKFGTVWVSADRLHVILRTTKNNARYLLDSHIRSEYKKKQSGETFIKGTEVMHLLDIIIQSAGSIGREEYARFSESIGTKIRDNSEVTLKRAKWYEYIDSYRGELKRIRMARFSLTQDELTGRNFPKKGCQFSHIRSVSMYRELADKIWNGLVVNKDTHNIITKQNINDENELFDLCQDRGWKTDWHREFMNELEQYRG